MTIFLAVASLFAPLFALNDTSQWFVDFRNGADAAGRGRSPQNALKHIEYCYDLFPDTTPDSAYAINLLPGRHVSESAGIDIDTNGPDFDAQRPLIIRSYYPELDSIAEVAESAAGSASYVFPVSVPHVIFDRLLVRGKAGGIGGIGCAGGPCPDNITVRNCVFLFDSTPGDARCLDNGVALYGGDSLRVTNSVFIGKAGASDTDRGDAVVSHGSGCRIINNTFYRVSYALTAAADGSSGLIFANNVLDSLHYVIKAAAASTCAFDLFNCGRLNFQGQYYLDNSGGAASFNMSWNEQPEARGAILSYDRTSRDFARPGQGSRFIDAGRDTAGVPARDFYGVDSSGRRDIGACEVNPGQDPYYSDTVHLYVDHDKADDAGDGRTIAAAKKNMSAAYDLIPATADSTYVINVLPCTFGAGRILTIDGGAKTFPSWTRCLVIQSYYTDKDSFATAVNASNTAGLIAMTHSVRHVHVRRLRFTARSGNAAGCAISFEKFETGEVIRSIKVSECVFDTGAGSRWTSCLQGQGGAFLDSVDIVNCYFGGHGGSGNRALQDIYTDSAATYGVRLVNNTFHRLESVLYDCHGAGRGRFTLMNSIISHSGVFFGGNYDTNTYSNFNCCFNAAGITGGTVVQGPDTLMRDPLIQSFRFSDASFARIGDASPCIAFGKDSIEFARGVTRAVTPRHDVWNVARAGGIDLGACQYDPAGITGMRTFQEGVHGGAYGNCEDAQIHSARQDHNYGATTTMGIGDTGADCRALVRFRSFTGIASALQVPMNVHIDSAFLALYCTRGGAGTVGAYPLTRDWAEGTADDAVQPGGVTWLCAMNGTADWGVDGAGGLGDAMPVSLDDQTAFVTGEWSRWNVTGLVQDWVSGMTNNGLLLHGKAPASAAPVFRTSDDLTDKSHHPRLVVYFDEDKTTLVRQEGTTPLGETYDTYLNEAAAGNNYGAAGSLVLNSAAGGRKRPLVRFRAVVGGTPNSVPPGAAVIKAELTLFRSDSTAGLDADESRVHGVSGEWTEGAQNGAAGTASWNCRRTAAPWSRAGASASPSGDAGAMSPGNTASNTIGAALVWRCDTAVQRWADGITGNDGLVVLDAGAIGADIGFYSTEGTSAVSAFYNPKITITCGGRAGRTGSAAWKKPALPLLKLYTRITGRPDTIRIMQGDTAVNRVVDRPEQIVVQNIGRGATENSAFSSADSLKNQFYLSFHTGTDSTDGMMNQFKTAATSPGARVRLSYDLLPDASRHYNLFNVVRSRHSDGTDSSFYADNVASLTWSVAESTSTRMRYRLNGRTVASGGMSATAANEFTVYPTGHVFVWDSAYTASTEDYHYGVQFAQRSGNGTLALNGGYYGGLYGTPAGQNTLHDYAAGFLSYQAASPGTPFNSVTAAGAGGFTLSGADSGKWTGTAGAYQQNFLIDFSRDDLDGPDSVRKFMEDKRWPCIIHDWRTGSAGTGAAGDLNGDGFNEREGCYELNTVANTVYFWFNEDSSRTRYTPAFKMNGYTAAQAPACVRVISADERVIDTCCACRGDVNISLNDAGDFVVFQLNRIIDGPCLILCTVDPNLAVEMNGFSGVADSGECRLSWTTESEQDNLGFRLLRRERPPALRPPSRSQAGAQGPTGDTAFTVIADYTGDKALLGMLTKATRTDYRYADRNVVLGMTYEYALESVDKDGAVKRHEKTVALTADRSFAFSLEQNTPNPFNPATVIRYTVPGRHSLARQRMVRLDVFDIRGRLVRSLVNEAKAPRTYRVIWDGRADNGSAAASALYVYRIEIEKKYMKTRKMIMVK